MLIYFRIFKMLAGSLIFRLKNSKAEKMDMSCIPGKIIGH